MFVLSEKEVIVCKCCGESGVILPAEHTKKKAYKCPFCSEWMFSFDFRRKEIEVGATGQFINIDSDGNVDFIPGEASVVDKVIAPSGDFRGKEVWKVKVNEETVFYPVRECRWSYAFGEAVSGN